MEFAIWAGDEAANYHRWQLQNLEICCSTYPRWSQYFPVWEASEYLFIYPAKYLHGKCIQIVYTIYWAPFQHFLRICYHHIGTKTRCSCDILYLFVPVTSYDLISIIHVLNRFLCLYFHLFYSRWTDKTGRKASDPGQSVKRCIWSRRDQKSLLTKRISSSFSSTYDATVRRRSQFWSPSAC